MCPCIQGHGRSAVMAAAILQCLNMTTCLVLAACARACIQGHGRSAVTAAAILMAMGGAKTADEALEKTVKVRFVTEFRM